MKRTQIIKLILVGVSITLFGIFGYMLIEGWSLGDALYMTAITLTTTGYQEVHALSTEGRYFTIVLLITGVGTTAYVASTLFNAIISLNHQQRGVKKMERKMKKLKDHSIVLGFGRMGQSVCEELKKNDSPFVVIEKREELIEEVRKLDGYCWIKGDADNDDNLKQAGIEQAKNLVSLVDDEAAGLFAAVAAKVLNPSIYVVVRANSKGSEKKMLLAGADKVVLPFALSGQRIAKSLINPEIEDFLEVAGVQNKENAGLQLVDIPIEDDSPLIQKTLRNCGLRRDGLIVVGIRKPDKTFIFAPDADLEFKSGDCLIAIGSPLNYAQVKQQLSEMMAS